MREEEVQDSIQLGDLNFDKSFLFARRANGDEIKFTRAERALLLLFTANVRKILTREQLLDAVSGAGSDVSDRNADYLINRLRAKLGDSARTPTLIATRYGEGYVWLADPAGGHLEALLVIGPVFGIQHLRVPDRARDFIAKLKTAIDGITAKDQVITVHERWGLEKNISVEARYSLDVSFYDDTRLHVALVLRDAVTRQILQAFRLVLDAGDIAAEDAMVENLAGSLKNAIWRYAAAGGHAPAAPADAPLEIRMHDAARLFERTEESWMPMGEQLAAARREKPEDTETNLMWAMHLRARLMQSPAEIENRFAIEDEIEQIVFRNLPSVQDNPVFMLAAAKLLLFVSPGHIGLAEQLAERAFASSTAFASSFSTLGQIKACKGEIGQAISLYDRGLEFAKPNSDFSLYLLVLKCAALLAAGDREALDETSKLIYAAKPVTRLQLGLVLAPPGKLAPDLELLLNGFDVARASRFILHIYYNVARLFLREEHRENVMRPLVGHLSKRFGEAAVPEEVRRNMPGLMPLA